MMNGRDETAGGMPTGSLFNGVKSSTTVAPIYLKAMQVPKGKTSYEMSEALEQYIGKGSILCSQQFGGLWEITPTSVEKRVKLIGKGATIWGKTVTTYDKNPFLQWDEDGNEIPTTKLFIENLPYAVRNYDIEEALDKLEVEMFTRIKMENAMDGRGNKHDRWLTGRRFTRIRTPESPLPDHIMVGTINVKLYHREQRMNIQCRKCLQVGHKAATCKNEVVCLDCKLPGHKRGDSSCGLSQFNCEHCKKPGHRSMFDADCELYQDAFPDCTDCGSIGHVSGDPRCKEAKQINELQNRNRENDQIQMIEVSDNEKNTEGESRCVDDTNNIATLAEAADDDKLCLNAAEAVEAMVTADEADAEAAEKLAAEADATESLKIAETVKNNNEIADQTGHENIEAISVADQNNEKEKKVDDDNLCSNAADAVEAMVTADEADAQAAEKVADEADAAEALKIAEIATDETEHENIEAISVADQNNEKGQTVVDDNLCLNAADAVEAMVTADEADAQAAEKVADEADAAEALKIAEAARHENIEVISVTDRNNEKDVVIQKEQNVNRSRTKNRTLPILKTTDRSSSKRRADDNEREEQKVKKIK